MRPVRLPKTAMIPTSASQTAPEFSARLKVCISQLSIGTVHTPLIK
jgi:hypothetical protein